MRSMSAGSPLERPPATYICTGSPGAARMIANEMIETMSSVGITSSNRRSRIWYTRSYQMSERGVMVEALSVAALPCRKPSPRPLTPLPRRGACGAESLAHGYAAWSLDDQAESSPAPGTGRVSPTAGGSGLASCRGHHPGLAEDAGVVHVRGRGGQAKAIDIGPGRHLRLPQVAARWPGTSAVSRFCASHRCFGALLLGERDGRGVEGSIDLGVRVVGGVRQVGARFGG